MLGSERVFHIIHDSDMIYMQLEVSNNAAGLCSRLNQSLLEVYREIGIHYVELFDCFDMHTYSRERCLLGFSNHTNITFISGLGPVVEL